MLLRPGCQEIVSFEDMKSMNDMKNNGISSPFLIKKIDETISLLRVDVSARVIKTRDIHLLEWAIIAPLNELEDTIPSLEEISREFGVEKIEFFKHVAGELTTLGVLEQRSEIDFKITELGKKLCRMGKMVSDPREIKFPVYYEPQSKEWLIGAREIGSSTPKDDENNKTPSQSHDMPDYVPEIGRAHV